MTIFFLAQAIQTDDIFFFEQIAEAIRTDGNFFLERIALAIQTNPESVWKRQTIRNVFAWEVMPRDWQNIFAMFINPYVS